MRALSLVAIVFCLGCSRREDQRPPRAEPAAALAPRAGSGQAHEPVALVELFTSEGCSSCPPADENLTRIAHASQRSGQRVIALSFHVDYWNYLGWTDPFSDSRYSARQKHYARLLGSNVYTPQMVVNGRKQLLGSSEGEADEAIARGLSEPASHAVKLRTLDGGRFQVEVTGAPRRAMVSLALAESAGDVAVRRGENAGRHLSHVNVVRAFTSREIELPGSVTLDLVLPAEASRDRSVVVAFAQAVDDARVLGAETLRLAQP
ncbi:MAG: DUF1223 domain-containing protein [Myxococcales bacterium]|nr:DUF1223 domain-containing protein [Myxococcales bacterium]